jgi:hypothetical protein
MGGLEGARSPPSLLMQRGEIRSERPDLLLRQREPRHVGRRLLARGIAQPPHQLLLGVLPADAGEVVSDGRPGRPETVAAVAALREEDGPARFSRSEVGCAVAVATAASHANASAVDVRSITRQLMRRTGGNFAATQCVSRVLLNLTIDSVAAALLVVIPPGRASRVHRGAACLPQHGHTHPRPRAVAARNCAPDRRSTGARTLLRGGAPRTGGPDEATHEEAGKPGSEPAEAGGCCRDAHDRGQPLARDVERHTGTGPRLTAGVPGGRR